MVDHIVAMMPFCSPWNRARISARPSRGGILAVGGVVLVCGAFPVAEAQNARLQSMEARQEAMASAPRAQAVLLLVRPRVGDTLQLRMEQTIEVTSKPPASSKPAAQSSDGPRNQSAATPTEYGPRRTLATSRITRLLLYAHSLVEASDLYATTLLATTDSMSVWAGPPGERGAPQMLPLPAEGRQVRVRVSPDGSMRINDPPPGAMELGATLASMPGMLPAEPVRVGDRWDRDIVLPSIPISGFRADGVVRARFRFDSLTRGGRDAWISMEGSLQRAGPGRELATGTRVIVAGTMRGLLVVDRQRAWIVDARTTMDVQSEVSSGQGSSPVPLVLDLRIQQRVRVK